MAETAPCLCHRRYVKTGPVMPGVFHFFYLLLLLLPLYVAATGTYQEPQEFIAEVFAGDPPEPSRLWLNADLKGKVTQVLGHEPGVLRLRYWAKAGRSAWILEEIGKERLITTGIVVNGGRIELIRILIFRESRGWEVRYPFFTDQFRDATLAGDAGLDRPIDGISGATLSVNAVTRLARLALVLHDEVMKREGQ